MTFQIMTDSSADLAASWCQEHDVRVLGMTITVDSDLRETVGENALTSDVLLGEMDKSAEVTTAAIGTGDFQKIFSEIAKNKQELVYLAFSSGLSGTYQSAMIARDLVLEEFPEASITVVDTKAAASGEGYLVEEAVKLRDAGENLAEVVENLLKVSKRVRSWVMVDDLNHLARGGRIPKATALLGTLASIKPILDVDAEGKLRQVSKIRGNKKAVNELIKRTLEDLDSAYPKIIVSYSGDKTLAETIAEQFKSLNPQVEPIVRPLGPVISVHTGRGTIAIFSVSKTERE